MSLDDVLRQLDEKLTPKLPHDPPPGLLYHYTDSAGFHGIFRTRTVWATDFRFLNDTQEMLVGERVFRQEALATRDASPTKRQAFILNAIVQAHDEEKLSRIAAPCVVSLSEEGNLLSQWRAYGAGGAGYSIGFSGFPLPEEAKPEADAALWLIKCQYDETVFRATVRSSFQGLAAEYEAAADEHSVDENSDGRIGGLFIALGLRYAAALTLRLKHSAFREEQEWRLILLPSVGREASVLEYRSGKAGLVPYVPVTLATAEARLQVGRVIVGPTQDGAAGVHAARGFLTSLGYDPDVVVASGIPFRG